MSKYAKRIWTTLSFTLIKQRSQYHDQSLDWSYVTWLWFYFRELPFEYLKYFSRIYF